MQLKLRQYHAFHNVTIGQGVPEANQVETFILQCPRCGTLKDPSVTFSPRNFLYRMWQRALFELGLTDADESLPNHTD